MTFIGKKGLFESEEKSKCQSKNGNENMNQKEWSLPVSCLQIIKMMVLNKNL